MGGREMLQILHLTTSPAEPQGGTQGHVARSEASSAASRGTDDPMLEDREKLKIASAPPQDPGDRSELLVLRFRTTGK